MSELKIAIDARLLSGVAGGVESVIAGLASGLSRISEDSPERYYFVTFSGMDQWLRPFVHNRCTILNVASPSESRRSVVRAQVIGRAPWLRKGWRALPVLPGMGIKPPRRSDGLIEREAMDAIHFPVQSAYLTDVPSIYHPHDLQHLHLPQFFSARERAAREAHYRAFCQQARVVVVTSTWMRDDLIRQYDLPPEKVAVVPWAPIVTEYPLPTPREIVNIQERLVLPAKFILYPAQTWPHKNHRGLIEALAILRRDGLRVPLVASGFRNAFHRELEGHSRQLGVDDQVHWVGFVTPLELQTLYGLATAVVIPTLFEAASGPLWEAFAAGVPAACSDVTSLSEQADGAALLFDPLDPSAIADAIARLWTDTALRTQLVDRGRRNVARFSWDRTSRHFRALYRWVAGADLSVEDRDLLDAPPLL